MTDEEFPEPSESPIWDTIERIVHDWRFFFVLGSYLSITTFGSDIGVLPPSQVIFIPWNLRYFLCGLGLGVGLALLILEDKEREQS